MCVSELIGNALEGTFDRACFVLRGLGFIYNYVWTGSTTVVEHYHFVEAKSKPDFGIELTTGIHVEAECKNLGFRKKDYVKEGGSEYWLQDYAWVQDNIIRKAWTEGITKMLITTSLTLFTVEATRLLFKFFGPNIIQTGKQVTGTQKDLEMLILELNDQFKTLEP